MGKMKVLLVQDIDKLGQAGEVKEVAGGFGRNYLIPKGFAVLATRSQVRQAEERLRAQKKREEVARRDAQGIANQIGGKTLRFEARVGELGRLYGSVTSSDIASKIQEQIGIEVDRRKIELDEPIKRIGIYPVTIRIMGGIEAVVNVVVEAEGSESNQPEPAETEAETETETEPTTVPAE